MGATTLPFILGVDILNKRKMVKRLKKAIKRRSKLRLEKAWRNIWVKNGFLKG